MFVIDVTILVSSNGEKNIFITIYRLIDKIIIKLSKLMKF
jgi:hypothetical protein